MGRIMGGILVLVLGLSVAMAEERQDRLATPAEQYKAILKEYQDARADLTANLRGSRAACRLRVRNRGAAESEPFVLTDHATL